MSTAHPIIIPAIGILLWPIITNKAIGTGTQAYVHGKIHGKMITTVISMPLKWLQMIFMSIIRV